MRDQSSHIQLAEPRESYAGLSRRPLHGLLFLLPGIVVFEIGSAITLQGDDAAASLKAEKFLRLLFEPFGVTGVLVPGLLVIAVLLIQHVVSGDRWRVRPGVLMGMTVEAIVWTVPLLILLQVLLRMLSGQAIMDGASASAVGPQAATDPGLLASVTIALGAGLFEELVFRLAGIALVHLILHDGLRIAKQTAAAIAVVLTSILFALYHPEAFQNGTVAWGPAAYYAAAGAAFAAIYLLRGFAIAAATHANYNLAVLVVFPLING